MNGDSDVDLEALGRTAAEQIAGEDSVREVAVVRSEDASQRPIYRFVFLIDQRRARQRAGLLRTRLVQRLRDELITRGDGHFPEVQILNREDWERRPNA